MKLSDLLKPNYLVIISITFIGILIISQLVIKLFSFWGEFLLDFEIGNAECDCPTCTELKGGVTEEINKNGWKEISKDEVLKYFEEREIE